MAERLDAMPDRSRLKLLMSIRRVFGGLPRMLVPGQVLRLSEMAGSIVSMRGAVV